MALIGHFKQAPHVGLYFRPTRSLIVELGQRSCRFDSIWPFFRDAHAGHRFATVLVVMQMTVLRGVGVEFHDAPGLGQRGVFASLAGG